MADPETIEQPRHDVCRCADPELDLLRHLIGQGVPQLEASAIVFGRAPQADASRQAWSTWIRLEVRRLGNDVRRRLGLPELPLTEEL